MLVAGLLAGTIAMYAVLLPSLSTSATYTSVSFVTLTTTTTSLTTPATSTTTVVHMIPKNTTVASGDFAVPNDTVPTSSNQLEHTGVILASFVVTNQTHLSVSFAFTLQAGGGACSFGCADEQYWEVLGPAGQILYKTGYPNPNLGIPWVVVLPPSLRTASGLQPYYLQVVNGVKGETLIFYPNAYLY